MPQVKPKLRKREIAFALAAGGLATFATAAILFDGKDEDRPSAPVVVTSDRQTYQVGTFDEIATLGPQDVEVTIGDTPAVRSTGSPRALSQLEVVVENGTLEIRPNKNFRGKWSSLEGATFYVTVPSLSEMTVAGSGDVKIDRISGDEFTGTIAGPGGLDIGRIDVASADFSIVGPGNITAAGVVHEMTVDIGGSGEVRAKGLKTDSANINIGGSGDVALTANDRAKVSIFGSGDVTIDGTATCSVSKMGSGDVTCGGKDVGD